MDNLEEIVGELMDLSKQLAEDLGATRDMLTLMCFTMTSTNPAGAVQMRDLLKQVLENDQLERSESFQRIGSQLAEALVDNANPGFHSVTLKAVPNAGHAMKSPFRLIRGGLAGV